MTDKAPSEATQQASSAPQSTPAPAQAQNSLTPSQPVDYTKPIQNQPPQPQPKVSADERLWAALSYVPLLALLALLVKPNSQYLRLHGRQGLLIFGIFFVTIFLYIILPPLGAILGGLIQLAIFIIEVYSAYQAFVGNWWKIPVLGSIAESIPVEMFTKTATQAITGQTPPTAEPTAPVSEPAQPEPPASTPPAPPTPSTPPAEPTPKTPPPQQ